MSFDTNMSMILSFQPNSVTAQGRAGLTVRSFGMPMRGGLTMLMADCAGWDIGSLGIAYVIGRNTGGIKSDTLALSYERHSRMPWFKGYHFVSKTDKGKHYSRSDGLSLSPPPKQRRRCEKEGGVAES
jgi:hypothetical protein